MKEYIHVGKPEKLFEIDYEKYVYAVCKCPLPLNYGIKIPKLTKYSRSYYFKCTECGLKGRITG